jgi:hypothetical protein
MPLRGIFVKLIAGVQLGHQPIVLYRATPSVLCFGFGCHVFLLYLQLAIFLFDAVKPDGFIPADDISPPRRIPGRRFRQDPGTI